MYNKGTLMLIASRPAMGKSALALDIARHLAKNSDKNILIISLEMYKEQVMTRLRKTGNNSMEYRNILIDDCPLRSVKDIEELCKKTENLRAVIIDYLQLIFDAGDSPKAESRQDEVFAITNALKRMALNLCVPIICTSQISKACECLNRNNKRPKLSDLCQSGVNVAEVDEVLFIYRERYYNPETPVGDMAECIVAKGRCGDIGTVKLRWNPEQLSFSKYEE